jgi:accessory gene regulator B
MIYKGISNLIFSKILLPYGAKIKHKDLYLYGLNVLIINVINVFVIVLMSFILNIYVETFFFLITFIPLRIYGNGIHAKTHFRCITIFIALMLGTIYLTINTFNIIGNTKIVFWVIITSLIIQYFFAKNKRKENRLHQKKIQFLFPLCLCLIAFIIFIFNIINPIYSLISILSILIESITLIEKNFRRFV